MLTLHIFVHVPHHATHSLAPHPPRPLYHTIMHHYGHASCTIKLPGILHNVASALRLTSLGRRDIWYAIYENHSLTAAKLDSMLKRLPADKLRTLDEFTVGVNQQRVNAMTQVRAHSVVYGTSIHMVIRVIVNTARVCPAPS